jgi:hypothetical protein
MGTTEQQQRSLGRIGVRDPQRIAPRKQQRRQDGNDQLRKKRPKPPRSRPDPSRHISHYSAPPAKPLTETVRCYNRRSDRGDGHAHHQHERDERERARRRR